MEVWFTNVKIISFLLLKGKMGGGSFNDNLTICMHGSCKGGLQSCWVPNAKNWPLGWLSLKINYRFGQFGLVVNRKLTTQLGKMEKLNILSAIRMFPKYKIDLKAIRYSGWIVGVLDWASTTHRHHKCHLESITYVLMHLCIFLLNRKTLITNWLYYTYFLLIF